MPPSADRVLIRPSTAAKILAVNSATVKRYIAAGHLEGFKLPTGPWRVYRDSVEKLAKAKAPPDLDASPY